MAKWRSSAAYRIALISFLGSAVGLALLGVVVFQMVHQTFQRELDSSIVDEARTLRDEYRDGGQRELVQSIVNRESFASPTRMSYALFSPDGRRIAGSLRTARPPLGLQNLSFDDPSEGRDIARGLALDLARGERLVVAVEPDWIERLDANVISIFVLAFIAACTLVFAGALVLAAHLRTRLRGITLSAEQITAGDIRSRVPVSNRGDEFDKAAVTLNRMLDQINLLLENLRQVSSDVAHDLRTPLARLRSQLERCMLRTSDRDALIGAAIEQVDEVLSVFGAILRISEIESGQTRRFFAAVDLSALLGDLADTYGQAFGRAGRSLNCKITPGLSIYGDGELIAQAFINLLENAQRHTPESAKVEIELVGDGDWVRGSVCDDGPGVPAADLDRITERFARLEHSRNMPGSGLGLSLAKAVATLHGGTLTLADEAPGLRATLNLPLRTADQTIGDTNLSAPAHA